MRMIGSPLDIDPNPEHAAALERNSRHLAELEGTAFLDGPEHVIVGGRQEGKTRLAEKWLREAPEGVSRVLVTFSDAEARESKHRLGLAISSRAVISFRQLLNRGAERGVEYGFDELVRTLEAVFGLHEPPRLLTVGTAAPHQGYEGS